jgi:predicted SAM-dependent methyltransferase
MNAVVRLNLGCGDKILEGYTNVDVAPERAGKLPDIICDIRKLDKFSDNFADEILAVHVVEHFWRWEKSIIYFQKKNKKVCNTNAHFMLLSR